jgi:hypothetical protein
VSIWHSRLLEVVEELGSGTMTDVRRRFVEKYGETLAPYDLAIVNGVPHWYRKVLWARNDLVKEGKLVQENGRIFIPKKEDHVVTPLSVDWKFTVIIYLLTLALVVILYLIGSRG